MSDAEILNSESTNLNIRTLQEPLVDHVQPDIKSSGIIKRKSHAHYKGYLTRSAEGKMSFSTAESFIKPEVFVKRSNINGYGVFAQKDYIAGETIEEFFCILTDTTTKTSDDWVMNRYLMIWDCDCEVCRENGKTMFIPTGYGAVYNHSQIPNAYITFEKAFRMARVVALTDILEGQEITRYYGKEYELLLEKEPFIAARIDVPEGLPIRNAVKDKTDSENPPMFRSMIVPENIL